MRNVRRDAIEHLESEEKDGEISQDDLRRGEAEVQKLTDAHIAEIDEMLKRKEARDHGGLGAPVPDPTSTARSAFFTHARERELLASLRPGPRPRARRHHHGRQRPLGREARPAAHRRAPRRRQGDPRGRSRRCDRARRAYLTIYSFCSENWRRPEDEVKGLMRLFVEVLEARAARPRGAGRAAQLIGRD